MEYNSNFEKELESLINKYSKENGSNTPDFILAEYLINCLENFNNTSNRREQWYGRENTPVGGFDSDPQDNNVNLEQLSIFQEDDGN